MPPTNDHHGHDKDTVLSGDPNSRVSGPAEFQPGQQIDRYKLMQEIGEGGFGTVYQAEQLEPVQRRVALKVIKPGMGSKEIIARFEAERQALALMDHPNIAKVLDAGTTPMGLPYFVMELVPGVPITEYCDRHTLSTRERLELFVEVCRAVQHAHQKGIIHRDIKPSNVLVAIHDGKPVPKVIDFGVAKAMHQRLTEKTVFTQHHQLIGTPEYMSPEQADLNSLDVDTRTDIYSLGVLLYELLAGVTPFDGARLRSAGYGEIQRIIKEEDPQRPSTRITSLGENADEIARRRRLNINSLHRQLRGDLDWIILKALEKDRTRRYETANGLAADLLRYLNDEPTVASPPSSAYRIRKFVHRHMLVVSFATVIFVLLVALATAMTLQAKRVARERDRANQQAVLAQQKAQTARSVAQFLVNLFEVSDPSESRGNSVTAREILDKGALRIRRELADQPGIQATLMRTIGSVFTELGLYKDAEPLLADALALNEQGEDELELALSLRELASLFTRTGEDETAEALSRRALAIQEARLGPEHPDLGITLNALGIALEHQGRLEEARDVQERAVKVRETALGPNDAALAANIHNLAIVHYFLGEYDEAEALYKRSAEIERSINGSENFRLATSLHTLAILYQDQGRLDEALPLELEALEIRERVLGPHHFHVALSLTALGNMYRDLGRGEESLPLIERAIAIADSSVGPAHGETLWMRRSLARSLIEVEAYAEAEELLLESLGLMEPEDPYAGLNLAELAAIYALQGRLAEAEANYRRALDVMEQGWGRDDPDRLEALQDYGEMLHENGRQAEAAAHFAEVDSLSR